MSKKNIRPWVFVSGKYSDEDEKQQRFNCRLALEWAAGVWERGGAAICPHYNSYMFDDLAPYSSFLKAYLGLLGFCDGVLMLPGWMDSKGARKEHTEARRLRKPILYADGGNVDIGKWIRMLKVKN